MLLKSHISVLRQLLKNERIHRKMASTLLKPTAELDDKVNDLIVNNGLKIRHHPGIVKNKCTGLPDYIQKAILEVLGGTSKKQLVKECDSLSKYLFSRQLPTEKNYLKSKISSIRYELEEKFNINKEDLSEEEKESYEKFLQFNTAKILRQRVYNWQPIIFTRHKGLQYLFSRSAPEFSVLMRIFNELKVKENFTPNTLFDFGSGVGSVIWAANETWDENSFKEYFCVDTSSEMNTLSEDIIKVSNENLLSKIFYRQFLPASSMTDYDIVISAYSFMELPSSASRIETLTKLWNKTNKYLVIVEQGTPAGFKIVAEARDFILNLNHENITPHVVAPCPHDLFCPRISQEQNIPCHFQVAYNKFPQKEKTRKELYSYVVLSKEPRTNEDPQWPRIVRPVVCKSRHVISRMCTKEGKLEEITFTAGKHGRIAYKCARKSEWGDCLPVNIKYIPKEDRRKKENINKDDNNDEIK